MLCKHHFSKNGQVFFHIFWVVTLIMQSRQTQAFMSIQKTPSVRTGQYRSTVTWTLSDAPMP
ncbi:hypothetical protein FOS38_11755 [Lactobacillus rhamnosus]|nr:hypothetical protein [Lacticaseibacillus rhamnosus]